MALQIKSAKECVFDQVSLGEIMLRLDPGDLGPLGSLLGGRR